MAIEAEDIDANIWYFITEGRVDDNDGDFASCLQDIRSGLELSVRVDQFWQLQPVEGFERRYRLRTNTHGPDEQMSACFREEEFHPNKTGICMRPSNLGEGQQWDLVPWDDGDGFKFINVDNGTSYYLDVHPGNPPFMSDNIDEEVPQPAQHWYLQSVKEVNDGAYSTVYNIENGITMTGTAAGTETGTGALEESPASNESPEDGDDASNQAALSVGAVAGIGAGAGLAVLFLGIGIFFLLKRRKRNQMWDKEERSSLGTASYYPKSQYQPGHFPPGHGQSPVSVLHTTPVQADDGTPTQIHEAPSTGRRSELP